MRIIVVGASRLGVALVTELLECRHDVVLVDRSRDRLDEVSNRLDCGFIEGDGTLPQTLRDAFGDGADALMLMTAQDDVNILGAVVGRSIGYERVILQIVRSELLDVCAELGFDDVVTPHATVAQSIVRSMEQHSKVWSQLDMAEGLHFGTYTLDEEHDGIMLNDLDLPAGARAVACLGEGGEARTAADTSLHAGDQLLVAAREDAYKALQKMFCAQDQT